MTAAATPNRDELREHLAELFLRRSSPAACIKLNGSDLKTEHHGLDVERVAQHVSGRIRWGAIPFVDAELVGWACVDLDVVKWGMDPDDPEAWSIVNGVVERLAARGIRGVVERSKSKGWHVWIVFAEPVPARDVRALLREIAIAAGARDESDLVCPRGDVRGDTGNGTWLPLYGGDTPPRTRFYEYDPDSEDWIEAADQAAVLRDLIANPTRAELIPAAPKSADEHREGRGERHPCTWIVEELAGLGIELHGIAYGSDKIQFGCPLHVAEAERQHGGSAVCWSDGHGHCSSSKCGIKWRTVAELVGLLGKRETPRIRSYVEIAPTREQLELLAAAPPIVPLATHVLYPRTTTVYAGQTGIGKTTSIVRVATDLIYGREPWTGRYDGRDPLRVLFVSKDDTTLSIVRKLAALAPDDSWMDGRIVIIGKELRPLALDDDGVEVLGNTITDGRFDAFVLDPYQHFLPPGLTVNDDEGARHTIDQLDRIAESAGVSGVLIHHPRKRPPKAKPATDLSKGERMEEIRGSAVLAQLARSVATLWEIEPGVRMLDAVVNDVPPLSELYFQTAAYGDRVVSWELAGPPTNAEAEAIRERLLDLEPGTYTFSALARHLFEIAAGKSPSGKRRTDAKTHARRIADELPDRFRLLPESGLEVL